MEGDKSEKSPDALPGDPRIEALQNEVAELQQWKKEADLERSERWICLGILFGFSTWTACFLLTDNLEPFWQAALVVMAGSGALLGFWINKWRRKRI